eukprot:4542389-Amphidinium_carterae.3
MLVYQQYFNPGSGSLVVVSDEEKKWWETKRTTSGAEVAFGNACHECWCKKEELFPFLAWDDLVAKKNAGEKTILQILNDGVHVGKALPCEKVIGSGGMILEITKNFVGLTAKDLRREAKVTKIPKKLVKNVPIVKVRSDKDPSVLEDCYIFPNPEKKFREVAIKTYHSVELKKASLKASQLTWADEGEYALSHLSAQQLQDLGMNGLTDKDGIPTLDEVCGRASDDKQGCDGVHAQGHVSEESLIDDEEGNSSGGEDDEEEEEEAPANDTCVSARDANASSTAHVGSTVTPKKPPSIAKALSSASIGSRDSSKHKATPAESRYAASSVGGESTVVITEAFSRGDVESWRVKLPVQALLDATVDGRRTTALGKSAVSYMQKEPLTRGPLLTTYHSVCKAAVALANVDTVGSLSTDVLVKNIHLCLKEVTLEGIPQKVLEILLTRKAETFLTQLRISELVGITHPFKQGSTFDLQNPRLQDLPLKGGAAGVKLRIFQEIIFEKLLLPLLAKGESGSEDMLKVCKTCLETVGSEDPLYLNEAESAALPVYVSIWGAFVGLLEDRWTCEHQALSDHTQTNTAQLPKNFSKHS